MIDLLRSTVKSSLGDTFIGNALKVERQSTTQLLVRLGDAWYDGFPFAIRSSKDELVSGSILSAGIVPPGVTIVDDSVSPGRGKLINFTLTSTPTNTYRVVIEATEEIITDTDDVFIKNATITENTGQKIRINFKINVVSESVQNETPIPYLGDTGAYSSANLVNRIQITPTASGNGELLSITPVSGANIDGRDLELLVRNDPGLGGGNPIPVGTSEQEAFFNGTLVDSRGTEYHINAIFLDADVTKTVIRVDKEVDQPNPELTNTIPYYLKKRNVFYVDDSTGAPKGRLFLPLATANWNTSNGFVHNSKVTDLRNSSLSSAGYQNTLNKKLGTFVTLDSGDWFFNRVGESNKLVWTGQISIINPHGQICTIPAGNAVLLNNGSLAYEYNSAGGAIGLGNISYTIASAGTTVTFVGAADLSTLRIGNIIEDSAGNLAQITSIDNVSDILTVSPALAATGLSTVYRDSFAQGTAPVSENTIILATRNGDLLYGNLVSETTSYSSNIRGAEKESLNARVGTLTDAVGDEQEDRSGYFRSNNTVTWSGTSLTFTSNIDLEVVNTKNGTITVHSIDISDSPISLNDGESLWVEINRTSASEVLTVHRTSIDAIPAQAQSDKDIFVVFRRQGNDLHIPFHKQVIASGQTVTLGLFTATNFDIDRILTSSVSVMIIDGTPSTVEAATVLINSDGNVLLTT
jgi:hypothetical protein